MWNSPESKKQLEKYLHDERKNEMFCNNVGCKYFIKKEKCEYKGAFDWLYKTDSGCKFPYCKLKNRNKSARRK